MVALRQANDVDADARVRAVRILAKTLQDDLAMARDIEAHAHSAAVDESHYFDLVLKSALNCRVAPANAAANMACMPDDHLVRGTVVQRVRETEDERRNLFARMLEEKYESIRSKEDSSVKCRRCNSTEILVEQKQTRSADEGMSVYCVCATCNNRWTMR